MFLLVGDEQAHRVGGLGDASRSVDARSDEEDQVADGQLSSEHVFVFVQLVFVTAVDVGVLQDGLDARTRFLVELLQAEVGQHAVFARDGHDVGGNAHGEEVEQFIHLFDGAVALHREGGDQLEAHATARELVVRIVAVGALGVEHGHGIGDDIASAVVVADDEVDAFGVGVFDAFHGLDAAVEGDDKLEAVVSRIVDTFVGDAVAFLVAVGDIELDFLLFEEAL